MADVNSLLNWGFEPIGSPLGSDSSLSMPTMPSPGLRNPMDETNDMIQNFVQQTQRRYGDASNIAGTMWDPRGRNALSNKPSDYKTTNMMRPDEIAVQLNMSDDQLGGGDPVLAEFLPDTSAAAQSLYGADIGLTQSGAKSLAESLSTYDKKVVDTIYMPAAVEPTVTNEIGLSHSGGGLPQAFFEDNTGLLRQGVAETVERVLSQSAQYQHVDDNGVVDKYGPGASPYDAIAEGRLAGMSAPTLATPSRVRSRTPLFFSSGARERPASSNLNVGSTTTGGGYGSAGTAAARSVSNGFGYVGRGSSSSSVVNNSMQSSAATGGGTSVTQSTSGAPVSVGSSASSTAADSATGGAPVYASSVVGGGSAGGTAQEIAADEAAASEGSSSKWWLIGLLGAAAAGGIYLATRKKSKRGRR